MTLYCVVWVGETEAVLSGPCCRVVQDIPLGLDCQRREQSLIPPDVVAVRVAVPPAQILVLPVSTTSGAAAIVTKDELDTQEQVPQANKTR